MAIIGVNNVLFLIRIVSLSFSVNAHLMAVEYATCYMQVLK